MQRTIGSLQAGRAIAALMVVCHHAASSIVDFVGPLPEALGRPLDFGYLGVDFFFVLSGFIIYYTTRERYSAGKFAYRRLTRIFVPYLPIGLGLAALYMLLPQLSASDREFSWLATATLLPASAPPALSVAWTLQHELVFYAIFGLLMAARMVLPGMLAWSAAILVATQFDLSSAGEVILGTINLEFSFGVMAAWAVSRERAINPWLAAGVATLLIGLFAFLGAPRELSVLIGAAIALFVPAVCRAELDGHIRTSATMLFLGAASYAIYLVHNPLLSILARIAAKLGLSPIAALLPLVILSALGGVLYYWAYERRALDAFRALAMRRRSAEVAQA